MRLKLSLLLVFIITHSWSQSGSTKTFTGNGTFSVPAGVTSLNVQAWGGGGSGGGASGAPLLLGRGAAGGGGGAYASNTILVTPGATLNVLVASQTSGTNGAGVAGGNSTISGFESSILAAGGSGGDTNNAGGSPTGGIGGTIAASAGSTRFSGANGGNGNSWNLLGLLLSSGAGGAGAGLGGAGGTAVSGLILSNAPGNTGLPPGGAGSGAINSALGSSQIGGAGAAGRIIIAYSCANFSLTSTNATSICGATGTTSSITLTGTATSLPVGNYEVTYNRSNPSATGLTANFTVSTAGTGIFTATGLTTIGSSTITITKLTSESCSSNISTNNTATITISPATVGGTVNGGTTINSGSTSGLLTLSGHTGTVLKWQSAVSPFTTWTDIANTTATYTSAVLTETTQFRAVVQSGTCAVVNSVATTVTVNQRPTIALASTADTRCSTNDGSASQTTLSYTATTGNPISYSIIWNASPANNFVPVTDAVLPTSSIIIAIPAGVSAGTYTGTLTVKNAGGSVSNPGSVFTVTINETPLITTTGTIASVCSASTLQNTTLSYAGVSGNPISYSIDWNFIANDASLADQPSTPFTFLPNGGIINNIQVSANVPAGTYLGILNIYNGICNQSQQVSITIKQSPTISLSFISANICSETNDISISQFYSSTTGSPVTYSIVWDSSPANSFANVIDEALPPSPINIVVPGGTATGTYSGVLTVKNAEGCVSSGEPLNIEVNETPTIATTGIISEVCTNSNVQNATLTYTATTNSPINYSIIWDDGTNFPDQDDTPFAFSSSGGIINTINIPANTPAGTYEGTLYVSNESCLGAQRISITVNPSPSVTFTNSTTLDICFGDILGGNILFYDEVNGDPTTYSLAWNPSPANNLESVSNKEFPIDYFTYLIPADMAVGTYTGLLTVKNAGGCQSEATIITINVNAVPTLITTGTIDSVCSSNNPQVGFFQYTASSGSATSYSIDWDQAANDALLQDKPSTSFNFAPNGGSLLINIAANVLPGTYSGTIVVNNASCSTSYPISITITTGLVGGTVTGGTTITSGSTSGLLTLSGTTSFVTRWQSSVSPFTVWSNIFTTNTTYTSGPLTETTQFRAVVQSGTCFAVNSDPTTVTVLSAFAKSTDTDSAEKVTSVTAFNQVINVETINQTINQVYVFDVSGNLLYRKNAVSDSKLVINTLRSSNQVLIVKVVLNDNRIATKKVIY